MKKKILLGFGALALAVITAPMFAAFEAHVINVTATIENALSVSPEPLTYGTVFPEEIIVKDVDVALSSSFQNATGMIGVDYVIRQKPKCVDDIQNPTKYGRVTEENGEFVCEDAEYKMLPLLCPFLSKHDGEEDGEYDGDPEDGDLDAFHGSIDNWTPTTTLEYQVPGYLTQRDYTDNWDIDLFVPCFEGSCAQDNVIKPEYQLNPGLEHALFGCDLWIEVTNVRRD